MFAPQQYSLPAISGLMLVLIALGFVGAIAGTMQKPPVVAALVPSRYFRSRQAWRIGPNPSSATIGSDIGSGMTCLRRRSKERMANRFIPR